MIAPNVTLFQLAGVSSNPPYVNNLSKYTYRKRKWRFDKQFQYLYLHVYDNVCYTIFHEFMAYHRDCLGHGTKFFRKTSRIRLLSFRLRIVVKTSWRYIVSGCCTDSSSSISHTTDKRKLDSGQFCSLITGNINLQGGGFQKKRQWILLTSVTIAHSTLSCAWLNSVLINL